MKKTIAIILTLILALALTACGGGNADGKTITVGTILGYGAMAGVIGGGGLGQLAITYGYYNTKFLVMWAAVIGLIILVQIFQSVGGKLAVKCDKRLRNKS